MGKDFTAVVDHQLSAAELYALPERMNQGWRLPAELSGWVEVHVHSEVSSWSWDPPPSKAGMVELPTYGFIQLNGPDGFHATLLHERAFHLVHLARWCSFLHEPDVRSGLRKAARHFARLVGATTAVLLPDNGCAPAHGVDLLVLEQKRPVHELVEWLGVHVGPPATEGDVALLDPDDDHPNVYCLERLAGGSPTCRCN